MVRFLSVLFPGLFLTITLLLTTSLAKAEEKSKKTAGGELVVAARNAMVEADYERSRDLAKARLRVSAKGNATFAPLLPYEQNQLLEICAISQLILGENENANSTMARLFRRDPEHQIDEDFASPPIQAAFQRARAKTQGAVEVHTEERNQPSDAPQFMAATQVHIRLNDPSRAVSSMSIYYRQDSGDRYTQMEMKKERWLTPSEAEYSAVLPILRSPTDTKTVHLEYFTQAMAPSGYVLDRLGNAARPKEIVLPPQNLPKTGGLEKNEPAKLGARKPTATPIPSPSDDSNQSALWIGLGIGVAVAAGLVVGGYFLLRDQTPSGSLGQVRVENAVRF